MESPLPFSPVLVADGRAVGSYPKGRCDVHDGHTWPALDFSREQRVRYNTAEQEQGPAPTQADTVSSAAPFEAEEQGYRQQLRELTTNELMTIWRKFGVHVVIATTRLFEKSKGTPVGDGSYAGFVRAVLAEVSETVLHPGDEWGYVVYTQTGPTVHQRVSNILPGDVIAFEDARLKGQKGLFTYTQTLGDGEPLVGIVSEFDRKKCKVSVWQANQHVELQANPPIFQWLTHGRNGGATQTVENVSYRLEDLESGQVKVSKCTFLFGLNAELLG